MITIDDVGSTLSDLAVDPDVIKQIIAMLDTGSQALGAHPLADIPGGAFGPAPAAVELATHTTRAHAKVAEAMVEMVRGLREFSRNIEKFGNEAGLADELSAQDLQGLQAATSCVATSSVADAGACTLPGEGD